MLTVEDIARTAYEVNRSYQAAFGDFTVPMWEEAPDVERHIIISNVRFRLLHPIAPVSALHERWMRTKEADGWSYGPVRNYAKKEHPCMLPFDELHKDYRVKDFMFIAVVDSLAGKLAMVQNGKALDEDRMGQSD